MNTVNGNAARQALGCAGGPGVWCLEKRFRDGSNAALPGRDGPEGSDSWCTVIEGTFCTFSWRLRGLFERTKPGIA